jgi:hypothetical protein
MRLPGFFNAYPRGEILYCNPINSDFIEAKKFL